MFYFILYHFFKLICSKLMFTPCNGSYKIIEQKFVFKVVLRKSIKATRKCILNNSGDRYKKKFQLFSDWRK